jgi:hypothetical protein
VPSSPSPSASRTGPLTTGPNVRPGEKPPVYPSAARSRNQIGAFAFAGYYYKALDWSIATNDDALIRAIAGPGCPSCRLASEAVAKLRARNEIELGGRIVVEHASTLTSRPRVNFRYDYAFRFTYREDAVVLVSPDGSRRTTAQASRQTSIVYVDWLGDEWRVANVSVA